MPQMAPMNWLNLLTLVTTTIMIIMVLMYFEFKIKPSKTFTMSKNIHLNWKW